MGGGEVSPYPIALSLATTFFSSITILGTPIEFYRFGTMFFYFAITYLICCILVRLTLLGRMSNELFTWFSIAEQSKKREAKLRVKKKRNDFNDAKLRFALSGVASLSHF